MDTFYRFPPLSDVSVIFLNMLHEIRVVGDLPCPFKFVRHTVRLLTDRIFLCLQVENEMKHVAELFIPDTVSLEQTISFDVSKLSALSGRKFNFVYANLHGAIFGYSTLFTLHIGQASAIYSNQRNEAIPQKDNSQDSIQNVPDLQNQFNSLKGRIGDQQVEIQEKEAIINDWQRKYQEALLTNEKLNEHIQEKQGIIDDVLGKNIELKFANLDKQRLESVNKENGQKLQECEEKIKRLEIVNKQHQEYKEEMTKRSEIMSKQHQEEKTKIKQELQILKDTNMQLRKKLEEVRKKEADGQKNKSKSFFSRGIEYLKGSESGTNGKTKRDSSPTYGYDESHTSRAEIIQEKPKTKSKPVAMVCKGRSTGRAAKPSSCEAPWEDPTVIGSRGFYHRDDFTLNATTETYTNSSENPTPMDCNNTRGGNGHDDESPSHSTKDDSNPNNSTDAGDGDKNETDHIAEQAALAFKTKECDLCGMVFNDEHDQQYILDHCKEHFDG